MLHTYKSPYTKYSLEIGYEPILPEPEIPFLNADDADVYEKHVIKPLLMQNMHMQKTAGIFAWPLMLAHEIGTKDISDKAETFKTFGDAQLRGTPKENASTETFLVFSDHAYNYTQALNTYSFIHTMAAAAQTSLSKEEKKTILDGTSRYKLNTRAYGMWTMEARKLAASYTLPLDERFPDYYEPNPESTRMMAQVDAGEEGFPGLQIPTNWGNFKIRNGGHIAIAISPNDDDTDGYQQFVRNAEALKLGSDIFGLFLQETAKGVRSTLDVYGIEPGFVANNYKPVSNS